MVVMFYPIKHHNTRVIIPVNLKKGVEATNLDELEFSGDDSNQYSLKMETA